MPKPALKALRGRGRASRRARLWLAAGCAVALASLMPAGPAAADVRTGTSPATGMTMSLDGAQITVSPGAGVSTAFLASVQGKAVTVACISGLTDLIAMVDDLEEGAVTVTRPFDAAILGGPASWPASSTSLSAALPRDVS